MMSIAEEIARYINDELMTRGRRVDNDQPLFSSGYIDSLGHVRLLSFIEKKFGIIIKLTEITIENFDTVDSIARFVAKKREE